MFALEGKSLFSLEFLGGFWSPPKWQNDSSEGRPRSLTSARKLQEYRHKVIQFWIRKVVMTIEHYRTGRWKRCFKGKRTELGTWLDGEHEPEDNVKNTHLSSMSDEATVKLLYWEKQSHSEEQYLEERWEISFWSMMNPKQRNRLSRQEAGNHLHLEASGRPVPSVFIS